MHTAELEEVVLDLLEDQRVDVPLRSGPVGSLAGFERDEFDGEPAALGVPEQRDRAFGEACLLPREEVLQLVVRKVSFRFGKVTSRDQVEVGLVVVVEREHLVGYLPADRLAVLEGREAVTEPRTVGPVAPESPDLLPSVRAREPQPVAGELADRTRRVAVLDPLDQPVAA